MIAVECLAFHSYHIATWTHIRNNILTDQYNGFVTLKDFELPDDGFDWGAETCCSDWSVINYPELICAFYWFIFVFKSTCVGVYQLSVNLTLRISYGGKKLKQDFFRCFSCRFSSCFWRVFVHYPGIFIYTPLCYRTWQSNGNNKK